MKYLVSDKHLQVHIPLICLGLFLILGIVSFVFKTIQLLGLAVSFLAPAYLAWVLRDDSLLKRFVRYSYWKKKSKKDRQKLFGEMCLLALKMDRPQEYQAVLKKHGLSEKSLYIAISEVSITDINWEDLIEQAWITYGSVNNISWHKLEDRVPNLISNLERFLKSKNLAAEIDRFKFNYFLKENKIFS